jgi:hypothetical protein
MFIPGPPRRTTVAGLATARLSIDTAITSYWPILEGAGGGAFGPGMTRNGKGSVGRPRRLARLHGRVVNKARIAPEPAAYAQRSCAAVRAFLRFVEEGFGVGRE